MASTIQSPAATLRAAWIAQAQASPWITFSLAAAAASVLLLLVAGGVSAFQSDDTDNVRYALLGGTAGFVATAFGAFLAIGLRGISSRTQDSMLGFAAGMMLAAGAFSLILPGLAAGRELFGSGPAAALTVV
ncbi:hypothetical protein OEZ79_26220, partial [Leclercia adecarboxylata]|nr:hypothetical protein [Leclercia adecarboxylata]